MVMPGVAARRPSGSAKGWPAASAARISAASDSAAAAPTAVSARLRISSTCDWAVEICRSATAATSSTSGGQGSDLVLQRAHLGAQAVEFGAIDVDPRHRLLADLPAHRRAAGELRLQSGELGRLALERRLEAGQPLGHPGGIELPDGVAQRAHLAGQPRLGGVHGCCDLHVNIASLAQLGETGLDATDSLLDPRPQRRELGLGLALCRRQPVRDRRETGWQQGCELRRAPDAERRAGEEQEQKSQRAAGKRRAGLLLVRLLAVVRLRRRLVHRGRRGQDRLDRFRPELGSLRLGTGRGQRFAAGRFGRVAGLDSRRLVRRGHRRAGCRLARRPAFPCRFGFAFRLAVGLRTTGTRA